MKRKIILAISMLGFIFASLLIVSFAINDFHIKELLEVNKSKENSILQIVPFISTFQMLAISSIVFCTLAFFSRKNKSIFGIMAAQALLSIILKHNLYLALGYATDNEAYAKFIISSLLIICLAEQAMIITVSLHYSKELYNKKF